MRVTVWIGIFLGIAGLLQADEPVPALKKTVDLLKSPDSFEVVLARKNTLTSEPDEAFEFKPEEKQLRVTGRGWGYLRTKGAYADYHLVAEFKWGEHTYGVRADRARDCGVFVQIDGRDGAVAGSWPHSIEVQLLESLSGNISLLGTKENVWSAVLGDEELEGERLKIPGKDWNEAWQDQKGWHSPTGKTEVDFGKWNRLEVICDGSNLVVKLNGQEVNRLNDLNKVSGKVGIQSELAECFFRRFELFPLGKFVEEWKPGTASTDTGYSASGESLLPRRNPLSPEESLAAWKIDGDYELQLVASEPLVCDPVDVVWDERGRMFVAEMRDYPMPPEGGPNLSRIRLLEDTDCDGVMDKATTWADELDHAQGLVPMNGGFLATTRTALLFLRDTNGDDEADEIRELFGNNEARQNQLQISSPIRGLDNSIYLNNGLDLKEIYPVSQPDKKLSVSRANLRIDPVTLAIEPVSGYGQFGATLDDWGRRFACSNRNPVMFSVMPLWAVNRNPFDHITQGHVDIAPSGADAKVYPFELSHTTSNAHAGTYTAACGLAVYRGDLMPMLSGNIFVCEPTAQLVTRSFLQTDGVNLKAARVGDKKDFLVSSDEWSRPVNLRNGPDGALYLCDMYRRFIDHSQYFPDEFTKSHYMRAGFDQGRIYRLVPKGAKLEVTKPLPEEARDLAGLLSSENAWQRIHSQRLLVEQKPEGVEQIVRQVFESSELSQGRLHAFWTLAGLNMLTPDDVTRALNDPHPAVVENAISHSDPEHHAEIVFEIARKNQTRAGFSALLEIGYSPSPAITELFQEKLIQGAGYRDPWVRNAVISGAEERAGAILVAALSIPEFIRQDDNGDFVEEFMSAVAARGNPDELSTVLNMLSSLEGNAIRFSLVEGFSRGLKKSTLKTKTIAEFIKAPPEPCREAVAAIEEILKQAQAIAADEEKPLSVRLAAIPLASQQEFESFKPLADQLTSASSAPAISRSALAAMRRFNRDDLANYFYSNWDRLSIESRRSAVSILAAGSTLLPLLEKMKAGDINPRLLEPIKMWSFSRSSDPKIKKLAVSLFGKTNEDRAKVIKDYSEIFSSDREPDLENGKAVLTRAACITCHRIGGEGAAVGPDLADVRVKPALNLLADILDPDRAVSEQWISHSVTTEDENVYTGIITGDDNTNISVKLPGGFVQTFPRETVKTIESPGISLMPSGMENVISKEDMFDLISYLKSQ